MTFKNEKTPFQAIKTRSSKSGNIDIFPKGLNHGFGPKMAIFPTFCFQAIQTRKMYYMIFQNEKTSSATCDWFGSYLSQQSQVVNVDWGFRQVARDYPKSFLEFFKKLLKRCSKNNHKLLFVTKVGQKMLENLKTVFAPMLKYENCTTKVRFLSIFAPFCSVTSVAK